MGILGTVAKVATGGLEGPAGWLLLALDAIPLVTDFMERPQVDETHLQAVKDARDGVAARMSAEENIPLDQAMQVVNSQMSPLLDQASQPQGVSGGKIAADLAGFGVTLGLTGKLAGLAGKLGKVFAGARGAKTAETVDSELNQDGGTAVSALEPLSEHMPGSDLTEAPETPPEGPSGAMEPSPLDAKASALLPSAAEPMAPEFDQEFGAGGEPDAINRGAPYEPQDESGTAGYLTAPRGVMPSPQGGNAPMPPQLGQMMMQQAMARGQPQAPPGMPPMLNLPAPQGPNPTDPNSQLYQQLMQQMLAQRPSGLGGPRPPGPQAGALASGLWR